MTKQLQNEFLQKLYNLLDEYDAMIYFDCDYRSDLYNVTGKHLKIDIGRTSVCSGYDHIDKSEIEKIIKNNK